MITVPTTLVLGAGASKPYGLPLGNEVKQRILDSYQNGEWRGVFETLHGNWDGLRYFVHEFGRSFEPSVDAFLVYRKEFLEIGRTAIAMALVPFESPGAVTDSRAGDNGGWYDILFRAMKADTVEEFVENRVRIVTFNYDRSLEFALYNHIQATRPKVNAGEVMQRIQIVHVYGQLGALPYQANKGERNREYNTSVNPGDVQIAAEHILLMSDVRGTGDHVKRAQGYMRESKRVYFLGFSYDPSNMERLAFEAGMGHGTALGLMRAERDDVTSRTRVQILYECDVQKFLREHHRLDSTQGP